jgi:hypothetical protein
MGRMILGTLLLATMLALGASVASPVQGHDARVHVASTVHQLASSGGRASGADAWAGVTGYTLAVGMIFTLIALVGLRACGRPTAHPGAGRRERL